MNIFSKITVFILLVMVFLLSNCKKKEKYPLVPEITFKAIERFGVDSAHLIISFTDGDGDIGLTESDTLEPYRVNFYINYFKKTNGIFQQVVLKAPQDVRIPILNTSKKAKALEGDIVVTIKKPYYSLTAIKDTIKYEMYIKDRALNESNRVFSTEIIVP